MSSKNQHFLIFSEIRHCRIKSGSPFQVEVAGLLGYFGTRYELQAPPKCPPTFTLPIGQWHGGILQPWRHQFWWSFCPATNPPFSMQRFSRIHRLILKFSGRSRISSLVGPPAPPMLKHGEDGGKFFVLTESTLSRPYVCSFVVFSR